MTPSSPWGFPSKNSEFVQIRQIVQIDCNEEKKYFERKNIFFKKTKKIEIFFKVCGISMRTSRQNIRPNFRGKTCFPPPCGAKYVVFRDKNLTRGTFLHYVTLHLPIRERSYITSSATPPPGGVARHRHQFDMSNENFFSSKLSKNDILP